MVWLSDKPTKKTPPAIDKKGPVGCDIQMEELPCILFTAFEPSGDEHAAPVIAQLRESLPDVPIYALGGKHMEAAGATLLEQTCGEGVMLSGSFAQIGTHLKRLHRLKKWLKTHRVAVHVPTDSPAANWSICKLIKKRFGKPTDKHPPVKVVHLVAPQVWAWAQWRVKRLIKWSDLVLCLLPFEPEWFAGRGVKAKFIGHPLFDHSLSQDKLEWDGINLPGGSPRLLLLPGSRASEIKNNWPDMLIAFNQLTKRHSTLAGVVVAANEKGSQRIKAMTPNWPPNLKLIQNNLEAALHWADGALCVSGTVTLHVARQSVPMTVIYRTSKLSWLLLGQHVIITRTFTLPNLVATGLENNDTSKHIVREFIPYFGDIEPVVDHLEALLTDANVRDPQIVALQNIVDQFSGHDAGREAADAIVEVMGM